MRFFPAEAAAYRRRAFSRERTRSAVGPGRVANHSEPVAACSSERLWPRHGPQPNTRARMAPKPGPSR